MKFFVSKDFWKQIFLETNDLRRKHRGMPFDSIGISQGLVMELMPFTFQKPVFYSNGTLVILTDIVGGYNGFGMG